MDAINQLVAKNLKKLRIERGLSQDDLARVSGISKSMLVQIERGTANPSLSTLQKLVNGMQVPFDALLRRPETHYKLVRLSEVEPILGGDGRIKNYTLFPDDENRHFSVYRIEAVPGAFWQAAPHMKKTIEFITVFGGALELTIEGDGQTSVFRLAEGDSIRFQADLEHSYRNISGETLIFHNILFVSGKIF